MLTTKMLGPRPVGPHQANLKPLEPPRTVGLVDLPFVDSRGQSHPSPSSRSQVIIGSLNVFKCFLITGGTLRHIETVRASGWATRSHGEDMRKALVDKGQAPHVAVVGCISDRSSVRGRLGFVADQRTRHWVSADNGRVIH